MAPGLAPMPEPIHPPPSDHGAEDMRTLLDGMGMLCISQAPSRTDDDDASSVSAGVSDLHKLYGGKRVPLAVLKAKLEALHQAEGVSMRKIKEVRRCGPPAPLWGAAAGRVAMGC